MNSYERAVEYAEYLVELGQQNPAALLTSPLNPSSKGKSIHQKLLEIHIEETGKQSDDSNLLRNTHLLAKLVQRDKLNCLVLNLYPGNEGYSLMLRSKSGVETETFKLPYEVTELLDYIDDSELPPFLVDILEKAQVNVFHNGCVIVEVRDYRRSATGSYESQYVLLKPTPQTLLSDINNMTSDGHVWTQEDLFLLESKLLLATEEPLCLDPSPAVLLVANRQQFDRKKLNNPMLRRAARRHSQAAMNRKRKFAQSSAPSELRLYDFIMKKKEKKLSVNSKLGKTAIDSWKQKSVTLMPPESVDVEKLAKVMERPEKNSLKDNTMNLVEEQILERDVTAERKLLAKLTIYHRPGDDAYLGELYLDHDYVEEKSKGTACRFMLGNEESVKKYLDQFREIFTEEGRKAVKITTQRPGQQPVVTCTQSTSSSLPNSNIGGNLPSGKPTPINVTQVSEVQPVATLAMGNIGGMKRAMPLQLSLAIGPQGAASQGLQTQAQQQGNPNQSANPLQLNIQSPSMNQSQRLQQQSSQSQTASQRLKQLGIHTNIGSRNNTPTASPVSSQPPIAQLFGSPTSTNTPSLLGQQTISTSNKTPTHTPTPTPPPIVSPPSVPANINRKPSLPSESSTIHHMAQTQHQTNVATLIQGESSTPATAVSHQPTGITSINIANITSIPPNINIQNLQGLPGMNIANLQGLQNMQVSLSLPGGNIAGNIAVPISMISTNPVLQNQQGIIATSGTSSVTNSQSTSTTSVPPTSVVTMITQMPVSTASPASSSNVVTGVLTSQSNVLTTPTGVLSLPIGNLTQLVPAGIKSQGQLRSTASLPVFQLGQQGIQLLNLQQQRTQLKTSATLQPGQTLEKIQTAGVKPTTSGPITTTILPSQSIGGGGQQVLSQLSMGKAVPQQGLTTNLTPQQLLHLPQQFQAQLQAFQKAPQQQQPQQQQQQLQFHQILKQQSVPGQPSLSIAGKSKNKKRTTPTPPK